jgi:hypothetical protein
MATTYKNSSPYAATTTFGPFLDVMNVRKVTAYADDVQFTINTVYQYRPDLLAHDLYGDAALWWVFAMRNPNTLKDPIFDFYPGMTIYIPKKSNLNTDLGL